ncbi:hypothetical protein BX616_011355 [Lobosporangium transversale]|nr:hypothetical protein BX616_011355 [Lobosporangium transversale]
MNLSPLDIPHIRDNIAQYLSQLDLRQCIRVSKEWSRHFSSFFWSEPFRGLSTESELDQLQSHQEHVRILSGLVVKTVMLDDISSSPRHWHFPKLKSLAYWVDEFSNDELVRAFQWSSKLTSVSRVALYDLQGDNDELQDQLTNTLSTSLPNLREFVLSGSDYSVQGIQRIFKAVSRCEHVSMDVFSGKVEEVRNQVWTPEAMAARKALDEMEPTNIEVLFVSFRPSFELTVLIPLLRKCPKLRELRIQKLTDSSTLTDFSTLVKSRALPQLKRLHLQPWIGAESGQFTELIKASGHGHGSLDQYHGPKEGSSGSYNGGLESLVVSAFVPLEKQCIWAIINHHSLTLINFSNFQKCSIKTLSQLANGLPHLRSLDIAIEINGSDVDGENEHAGADRDPLNDSSLKVEGLGMRQWTCLGLRELGLELRATGFDDHDDDEGGEGGEERINISREGAWWEKPKIKEDLNEMFTQLGRLEQLQELFIQAHDNINVDILALKHGYLSRLCMLKQLRGLCYEPDGHRIEWGQEEAQWMVEHWTKLVCIEMEDQEGGLFQMEMLTLRPWITILI